jgi:hypothetical protein
MRDIPGFEGQYSVTESGEVWSHPKRVAVGTNGGFREQAGRFLKLSVMKSGHLRVYLTGHKPMLVHRAVALAYIPNPDGLPFINHIDGSPANNHVSNLEWCTPRHNSLHAFAKGLTDLPDQRGEKNANAKLTRELVKKMRAAYAETPNCAAVARHFGVAAKTAWDAIKGRRWVD